MSIGCGVAFHRLGADKGMDSVLELRKARRSEWPAVLHLQSEEKRPPRKDSQVSDYFVALDRGILVGCVGVREQEETGYLYGLVVAKKWRRRGIGHALVGNCIAVLQKNGMKRVYLLAMFWNIRFFSKHGFSLVDRQLRPQLASLHVDFVENWARRSALLCLTLRAQLPT
jgi:N-acetylglutamate synthase-like GNAT family acetyltransferase